MVRAGHQRPEDLFVDHQHARGLASDDVGAGGAVVDHRQLADGLARGQKRHRLGVWAVEVHAELAVDDEKHRAVFLAHRQQHFAGVERARAAWREDTLGLFGLHALEHLEGRQLLGAQHAEQSTPGSVDLGDDGVKPDAQ